MRCRKRLFWLALDKPLSHYQFQKIGTQICSLLQYTQTGYRVKMSLRSSLRRIADSIIHKTGSLLLAEHRLPCNIARMSPLAEATTEALARERQQWVEPGRLKPDTY